NYPYLSVETSVSPETVAVNGTIDTTIRLRGDGWALQPDPIDVVLVIDRSGSMRYTDVSPSRLGAAQSAALTFIDQMSSVRDRVGLVSFSSSTTRDDDLTCSFETVKSDINSLSPNGATQLRRAIYEAILMEQEQGRAEAVKAVVVLTDGDWNYDGSPIGHGKGYPANSSWAYTFSGSSLEPDHYRYYDGLGGTLKWKYTWGGNYLYCTDGEWTNQNMSRFADANGVKLYTITFAYNPSTTVRDTMRVLANATGGFYEHATDGTQLTDIYRRIAGELKVEAGVNTTMDVCFENVEVNGTPKNGADVFDYVYAEDYSTRICSYRTYPNGTTVDMFPEYTRSDAQNWTGENPVLHFDVGTVRLNQTWETTFRLKVLADGNINVFGSGSTIIFNDGTDTLDLPDLFITAIPDLNNTGVETGSLDIANLRCTGSGPYLDFLPLAWDLTYTGADEVTEDIYCQNDGVSWIYAASKTPEMAGGTTITENYLLDVRHLPPGTYTVRVRVTAPDAPVDQETLAVVDRVGPSENSVYIRIQ
ncbi:VWA domain-containing protein, partial [Methanoculleus sp. FWC-SCC1]